MKTKKNWHKTIGFVVMILRLCACVFAIQFVLTTSGYAADTINKGDVVVKGFVKDIEKLTLKNDNFRRVLYTTKNCQLVIMSLKPKEEIGTETHKSADQFFRVEAGSGELVLNGVRTAIRAGFAIIIPSGATHNIINTGNTQLKLYTIYVPPVHRDGVIHHTRKDAEADDEHFDGKTTE